MGKAKLSNITETNNLIYCGAALVTETLGINKSSKRKRQEPWWKRRVEGQLRDLTQISKHPSFQTLFKLYLSLWVEAFSKGLLEPIDFQPMH